MVYKKAHFQDKIEDKFLGPFRIVGIEEGTGRIILDEGNKLTKQNVKNVKPVIF